MTLKDKESADGVVVIGGGLAGMATVLHLSRAGMDVVCIDGGPVVHDPVGESLDWSAPELLKGIGLSSESLLRGGMATPKRHVILKLLNGSERHYEPGAWLGRAPFHVELSTLHVDRAELGDAVRRVLDLEGIQVVSDRVVRVGRDGRHVVEVQTEKGDTFRAKWFVDASGGSARIFARAFDLPSHDYGPTKVAMWDYFKTASIVDGTTLYGKSSASGYLDWIWQIPIRHDLVSVGSVSTGDAMKEKRQSGLAVHEIYESNLNEFAALAPLLHGDEPTAPRVTSFRCRVHEGVAGPNWLVVGEAASMVDPMTSNGVTAALRHAREAADLIIRARKRDRLSRLGTMAYTWRLRSLASFFNSTIEKVMYETPIRLRIGALQAGDVYTIPAWLMNLIYTRLQPRGIFLSAVFCSTLDVLRLSATAFSWACRRDSSMVAANEAA